MKSCEIETDSFGNSYILLPFLVLAPIFKREGQLMRVPVCLII